MGARVETAESLRITDTRAFGGSQPGGVVTAGRLRRRAGRRRLRRAFRLVSLSTVSSNSAGSRGLPSRSFSPACLLA
jgi:hypothetical protein